jgi:hypothetical protein
MTIKKTGMKFAKLKQKPYSFSFAKFGCVGIQQWGCTTGNAATVVHSTKKTTSGKDSVIEGQPLLLFM